MYYADAYDLSQGINDSYYKVAYNRIARAFPTSLFRSTATSTTISDEMKSFLSAQTAKPLLVDLHDVNNRWG